MITGEYCRIMAKYNTWQNNSLYRESDLLLDADRRVDRGAFFGSIHNTLSHILWGDTIWMSRFAGWKPPGGELSDSGNFVPDWNDLRTRRKETDEKITAWAAKLDEDALTGELKWYSPSINSELSRPIAALIVHFFNHQTHHRGQVHAMLTAAGRSPDATDLPFMPADG